MFVLGQALSACLLLMSVATIGCSATQEAALPAHVPDGYSLVYEQDFEQRHATGDFRFTDADAWRQGELADGGGCLELHAASEYRPTHRSPYNIALIGVGTVGSFVLDVDMQQTGREYGHRDLCVFFGFNDPDHYYYTHMATTGDQNAHQVFIVNDGPRTPITTDRTEGVDWGTDIWRHIRVVRDAEAGTISVYFDDMENPVQVASDTTFTEGYIGFGSFDDTGRMDNIRVYAPSISDTPCEHPQRSTQR